MAALMQIDVPRLYAALDQTRQGRNLSWRQLAAQLQISPSTFSRMSAGAKVDTDALVTLTAWLGRPVETFVVGWYDQLAEAQEEIEGLRRALAGVDEEIRDARAERARALAAEKAALQQRDGWERAAHEYARQLGIARQQLVDNGIEPDRRIM